MVDVAHYSHDGSTSQFHIVGIGCDKFFELLLHDNLFDRGLTRYIDLSFRKSCPLVLAALSTTGTARTPAAVRGRNICHLRSSSFARCTLKLRTVSVAAAQRACLCRALRNNA